MLLPHLLNCLLLNVVLGFFRDFKGDDIMKKIVLIFLFLFTLTLVSCNKKEEEALLINDTSSNMLISKSGNFDYRIVSVEHKEEIIKYFNELELVSLDEIQAGWSYRIIYRDLDITFGKSININGVSYSCNDDLNDLYLYLTNVYNDVFK